MPDKEAKEAKAELQERDLGGEAILAQRPAPDEPEVQQRKVARLDEAALIVGDDFEQAQLGEQTEAEGDERVRLAAGGPGRDRGLEEAGAGVEARHAVSRAGHEAEDLGRRVGKVEELRDEQEAERLGEVAEDADDGKDHAGEVAVGVADEDAGGVPVVAEEGGGDADPGQEEVEGEEVGVGGRVRVGRGEVEDVVEGEEEGDDDALGDLDAVDAGEHVDALRTEHGYAGHVEVVERAEVEELAEVGLQLHGDDDARHVKVDKVDDEDGDGGQAGDPPLVPPANVKEVVADSEESNSLQGDDGAQVRSKLGVAVLV